VGSSSYPGDGRHLALLTNEEHGALLNASGITRSDAATDNNVITKQGHDGKSSAVNDGLHSGATVSHAVSVSTQNDGNSNFILGQSVIAIGVGTVDIPEGSGDQEIPDDATGEFPGMKIPIANINTGGLSAVEIASRYAVVVSAYFMEGDSHGSDDYEGGIRVVEGWEAVGSVINVIVTIRAEHWTGNGRTRFGATVHFIGR